MRCEGRPRPASLPIPYRQIRAETRGGPAVKRRSPISGSTQPQLAPSHWALDQVEPLQVEPLHVFPLHVLPDQVVPLHVLPDQVEPLHVLPLQVLPDQVDPFHTPPDQLAPAASRSAIRTELKGWPKMSSLPWSTTPLSERWFEPRVA